MLDHDAALAWMARWDRQQEGYLPDREERFTAMIDAVEALGRPDPLVADLGCGPGSLAARLVERLPGARVVGVDADPLLLGLGRAAYPHLTLVSADLRKPGWTAALGLDGPADAAVSTTALHWIDPEELKAMYADVASILRPGGLLLNGDHLDTDDATPRAGRPGARRARQADRPRLRRRPAGGLAHLVGRRGRRPRPGGAEHRPHHRRGRPPRLGVPPAVPPRRRPARGRLRRGRHPLAARPQPPALRGALTSRKSARPGPGPIPASWSSLCDTHGRTHMLPWSPDFA
ncbi:class I SAM-dependent methyltransferase [Nonomuraea ferruginea]